MKGSIKKRGDKWSALVDLPPDPATGKRRRTRITAASKREVENLVAAAIAKAQTGFVDARNLRVRDFIDHWLESTAPSLRPSTVRRYRDLTRLHIVSMIGDLRLARLTPSDIQRLYANRLSVGLSPSSVRQVHGVLHHALDDAVRWGLLARNVTDAVEPPRRVKSESRTWDARQVAKVLETAIDDDLEALWRLAILTGMRRGEVLGLRWADIDFDAAILSVRRTLSRGATSRLESGEPKTASGRRRIALPQSVLESLRRHRIHQLEHRLSAGPAFEDQDLVFTNPTGGPLHPNSLALRFRQLINRAGVPPIRFHDLRHTCASLMLSQGEHPKVVQERLGHADISMTMNLYSHVAVDMQRQAADRLDAALEAAKPA